MKEKTVRPLRHKLACARLVGRSHAATSIPCQDFVAARTMRGVGGLALADGAGSRVHSGAGAEESVKSVLGLFHRDFEALHQLATVDPQAVARQVLDTCLARLRRRSRRMKCDVDAFACTLLFVAHKSGRYIAGHLGDGVIAMDDGAGKIIALSHPDNGEYANTTTFVTEHDAVHRLRIYVGECGASAFAVMSDGTAESLYLRAGGQPAEPALKQLFHWTRTFPRSKTEGILTLNLEQAFSKKTTDDCSIGLMAIG